MSERNKSLQNCSYLSAKFALEVLILFATIQLRSESICLPTRRRFPEASAHNPFCTVRRSSMSRHLQLYELVKRPNIPILPYTNASNPILPNLPEVFCSPVQFQSDTLTPPPPPPIFNPPDPRGMVYGSPMPSPPELHHSGSVPPLETSEPENPKIWTDLESKILQLVFLLGA